jgi:hypothetical protein
MKETGLTTNDYCSLPESADYTLRDGSFPAAALLYLPRTFLADSSVLFQALRQLTSPVLFSLGTHSQTRAADRFSVGAFAVCVFSKERKSLTIG